MSDIAFHRPRRGHISKPRVASNASAPWETGHPIIIEPQRGSLLQPPDSYRTPSGFDLVLIDPSPRVRWRDPGLCEVDPFGVYRSESHSVLSTDMDVHHGLAWAATACEHDPRRSCLSMWVASCRNRWLKFICISCSRRRASDPFCRTCATNSIFTSVAFAAIWILHHSSSVAWKITCICSADLDALSGSQTSSVT